MIRAALIALSCLLPIAGCASPLKLENVTGTWTCPRIDGVCAGIDDVDTGLPAVSGGGAGVVTASQGAGNAEVLFAGSAAPDPASPARSADEIARIVIAPLIDANGFYHARREIFVVIATGSWISAPEAPAAAAQTGEVRGEN